MEFIKSEIKNIVIFVAILLGLYFAWSTFFKSDSDSPTQVAVVSGSAGDIGGDILPILLQLKDIKLNRDVFSDPAFVRLKDFGVDILLSESEKGRPNPFAPLEGGEAASSPQINIGASVLRR